MKATEAIEEIERKIKNLKRRKILKGEGVEVQCAHDMINGLLKHTGILYVMLGRLEEKDGET